METIDKEMIMEVLKDMRLRPKYDEDGDIIVKYQMHSILVLPDMTDEGYIQLVMPNIYSVDSEEKQMTALYVCNKVTKDSKHVKAWLNDDMDLINVTSEFYVNSNDALQFAIKKGLDLLSTVSYVVKKEMSDYLSQTSDDEDVDDTAVSENDDCDKE